MAKIIDGKKTAASLRASLKATVESMKKKNVVPGLAVILVGDDPASRVYAHGKQKACDEVGIHSEEYFLPESTSEEEVIELIERLNNTDTIDGILVEMPLPKHISANFVTSAIAPEKDVDCCGPVNIGKLFMGEHYFAPCTPAGCMELLKEYGVEIEGRRCVVVGRSNFVGKPMAMLLMEKNGTVTMCHSRTKELSDITSKAEILVTAIGKPKYITADMVGEGAVVIDVGINRDENGKLCGDVDYAAVEDKASMITPVPGGVGPMTVTVLLKNTVESAKRRLAL